MYLYMKKIGQLMVRHCTDQLSKLVRHQHNGGRKVATRLIIGGCRGPGMTPTRLNSRSMGRRIACLIASTKLHITC